MATFILCIIMLCSCVVEQGWCGLWSDAKTEYVKLYQAYAVSTRHAYTDVIPKTNFKEPLNLSLTLELHSMGNFDAVGGALDIIGSLSMTWLDEIISLKQIKFNPDLIKQAVIDFQKVWTPVIVLLNSADSIQRVGDATYKVRFDFATGLVTWKPRMILQASCSPDVRFFPFDQQKCSFKFVPCFQDSRRIKLSVSLPAWNNNRYSGNGIWDIVSTDAETYISGNYYVADFSITINREPTYFTVVLVLPILLLSLLSGVVFLLPAASGERVGFGVTCFLSFVVLLQMTMNFLPQTSAPMSFLCYYIIGMVMFSAFLSIVNILLLRVYHKGQNDVIPRWIIHIVEILKCIKCKRIKWRHIRNRRCKCRKPYCSKIGCCDKNSVHDISVAQKELCRRKHDEERHFTEDSDEDVTINQSGDLDAIDWIDVGKLLDILFLFVFLGVQGAFSFFFLIPIGTKY